MKYAIVMEKNLFSKNDNETLIFNFSFFLQEENLLPN